MSKKVLVAMSGGVDSSVAALLLTEGGYQAAGVTMCLGVAEEGDRTRCCGRDAVDDARRVCDRLHIPHYVMDYAGELEEKVIDKFASEYLRGRTPNPCIDCNRYLKFGTLLAKAKAIGFDYLATGHYARIEKRADEWCLLESRNGSKDQTYFLYPMAMSDLPSILFPLGDMIKEDVRALARQAGLPIAEKAESQDICFVIGDYRQFILEKYGDRAPGPAGDMIDRSGRVLGRHRGLLFYTIGQRSGLGISAPTPRYVIDVDAGNNRIVIGAKEDLMAPGLIAGDLNLLVDRLPEEAKAKIRYRKKAAPCRIEKIGERLRLMFAEPQESITPGQAVVLYEGDRVLGGGVIEEVIHDTH